MSGFTDWHAPGWSMVDTLKALDDDEFYLDPSSATAEGHMREAYFMAYGAANLEYLPSFSEEIDRRLAEGPDLVSAKFVIPHPPGTDEEARDERLSAHGFGSIAASNNSVRPALSSRLAATSSVIRSSSSIVRRSFQPLTSRNTSAAPTATRLFPSTSP